MIAVVLKTLPLSTNSLWRHTGNRTYLTTKGRDNKTAMAWEARSQYRGKPLEGRLALDVALYWPTKRNHDIDNIKGLLDSMTGVLWKDDGQIDDLHVRKEYDKGNPRVELEVFEL